MIHDRIANQLVNMGELVPDISVQVDIKFRFIVIVAGIKGGFITHRIIRANSAVLLSRGK